jgi:Carboxypeptidase regulatory-like domain
MQKIAWMVSLAVIFGALTCANVAMAQNSNSGDIRGTVTDASGSVVPGAAVIVKNDETGVVSQFVTNSDGLYDTNSILPGTYTITFSKVGFEKLVKASIIVAVGVITVNGELRVGATTQEVTVTSSLPLLKTENAQQSTTLPTQQLTALPEVNPQNKWLSFMKLLPGAAGTPAQGNAGNPGIDQAIEGTSPYFSSYLIDGGSIRLPASANIDEQDNEAIAEVQVIALNSSAEYGGGGNVFNLISKTGTNQWHGAAYDYLQNDAFNARDFFNSSGPKARQRYNYFGGSLGGPVIKNKFFFYFNFENLINPNTSTATATVPTDAMKAGCFDPAIFGTNLTLDAAHGGAPLTTNAAQCGAYNPADLAIPTADMDPVALNIQKDYVTATNQNLLSNNYRFLNPGTNNDRKEFIRLDYNLSEKNRLNTTLARHTTPLEESYSAFCPIQCELHWNTGYSGQISDVYLINPNMVNEFRFSTVRQGNWFIPASLGKGLPAQLGLQFSKADEYPDVSIGGIGGNNSFNAGNDTSAIFIENSFAPSDVLTLIRGKHILHFGGEVVFEQNNSTPWGNLQGAQLNFSGQYTAGTGADVGYADFLLGDVQSWSARSQGEAATRSKNPSFFAQDDIKVRPNLTVNLGVRWEIHGGFSNPFNEAGGFDPTLTNPITNTPGSIWFAGLNGARTQAFETKYDAVLPRLGFAWTLSNNWVVRGGVGQYATLWSSDTAGGNIGFGTASLGTASANPGQPPVVQLSGTGANLPYIVGPNRNPGAYNGQGNGFIPYMPYDLPVMKGWQWNVSVQRRLPGNMVLEAAYVGSHWNNLMFEADINQVPADKLGGGQAARPYPQYLGIGPGAGGARTGLYTGISNYNAAQFTVTKPFGRGLSVDVNFTWSQMKDDMDTSGWGNQFGNVYYQDAYNPSANYGLSNFDTPKALKGAVVYEIPLGKGHRFFSSAAGDAALGGWQASTIFIAQSGAPITLVMSSATNSGALDGSWYPNLVGNPSVSNQSLSEWFNQLAYATPATNTFGNNPRNSLRGPDLTDVDFSLGKSFGIPGWERGKLQIRMDATNFLNHPSFRPPNNNLNAAALTTGVADPSVGAITATTITGRVIQLSARFSF